MRAIISGAGIAGLAAAHALDRAGWQVVVLEQGKTLRTGGAMLDFCGPDHRAAASLGLLDDLEARRCTPDQLLFVAEAGGAVARIDYERARRTAGGPVFPILRGDLEAVLNARLPRRVERRWQTRIAELDNRRTGVAVRLSDGSQEAADLLVGAEGVHSELRGVLFGPEQDHLLPLGCHMAAYSFRDAATAAVLGAAVGLLTRPGRLLGLFVRPDGRVTALLVWRSRERSRRRDPRDAIEAAFAGMGWLAPRALAALPRPEDIHCDVVAQVELETWHRDRVVLIGDAAHAVSLFAGQGGGLAIAGAAGLAAALARSDDIATGLAAFEAGLRPLVRARQRAGRRAAAWLMPPDDGRLWLRNVALRGLAGGFPPGLLGRLLFAGVNGIAPAVCSP